MLVLLVGMATIIAQSNAFFEEATEQDQQKEYTEEMYAEAWLRDAKPRQMASVGETESIELDHSISEEVVIRAVWINSFDPGYVITLVSQDQPDWFEHRVFVKQIGLREKIQGESNKWSTTTIEAYFDISEDVAEDIEARFFDSGLQSLPFTPVTGNCTDGSRLWFDAANDENQKIELTRHHCDEGFFENFAHLEYLLELVAENDPELGRALNDLTHR